MVKNKYFYYLFMQNALINLVNYMPRILIHDRFNGALLSMIIGLGVGTVLLLLFVKMLAKFPQQGLPEIIHTYLPRWIGSPVLIVMSSLWITSSVLTLVGFVDMTNRFISPDVSPYLVLVGFLVVVGLCARLDSESILYGLEIILYMTFPLIIYMVIRAYSSPYHSWDAILQVVTYLWKVPQYKTIAAATYVFTGYTNMVIFNRVFKRLRVKHLWFFVLLAINTLFISVFAPIGFLGAEGVGEYVYPAFSTIDSVRIRYFIIERMIYVFYVVYMCLSLVNSIIHWHVSKELIMGAFKKVSLSQVLTPKEIRGRKKMEWYILAIYSVIVYISFLLLDQFTLADLAVIFLNTRLVGEVVLLALMFYFVMRRRGRV